MNTTALFTLISCGTALAGNIDVTSDVISSETWTADNTYNLTQQIYVRPCNPHDRSWNKNCFYGHCEWFGSTLRHQRRAVVCQW